MVSNIFLLEVECRGDFDSIVSIFKTEMSAKSSNAGVKQKGRNALRLLQSNSSRINFQLSQVLLFNK